MKTAQHAASSTSNREHCQSSWSAIVELFTAFCIGISSCVCVAGIISIRPLMEQGVTLAEDGPLPDDAVSQPGLGIVKPGQANGHRQGTGQSFSISAGPAGPLEQYNGAGARPWPPSQFCTRIRRGACSIMQYTSRIYDINKTLPWTSWL